MPLNPGPSSQQASAAVLPSTQGQKYCSQAPAYQQPLLAGPLLRPTHPGCINPSTLQPCRILRHVACHAQRWCKATAHSTRGPHQAPHAAPPRPRIMRPYYGCPAARLYSFQPSALLLPTKVACQTHSRALPSTAVGTLLTAYSPAGSYLTLLAMRRGGAHQQLTAPEGPTRLPMPLPPYCSCSWSVQSSHAE